MTKHDEVCPKKPVKKQPGEEGFFFLYQIAQMKNGRKYRIVITRTDQLDGVHRAQEEDRIPHKRPKVKQ